MLEKFRTGEYEVKNLNVIDEASTRLLEVGGLKIRLFGLGGVISMHKLCELSLSAALCTQLMIQSITVSPQLPTHVSTY